LSKRGATIRFAQKSGASRIRKEIVSPAELLESLVPFHAAMLLDDMWFGSRRVRGEIAITTTWSSHSS
jgi:hypothetical protein